MVEVVPDKRLRTTARWELKQETIHVRIPPALTGRALDQILDDIVARVLKQRHRARQQHNGDLEKRASALNQQYFGNELRWHTIRWVDNMAYRLGSCSVGGSTDGDIRISQRVQGWPDYVIDYIVAHELAHRKFPNHSPAFWDYLSRYPQTERARGFIDGIAYAQGEDPDKLI
jgi:predicted metal-dependent hydrolase